VRDRAIIFAGYFEFGTMGDVWSLFLNPNVAVPDDGGRLSHNFSLSQRPNPSATTTFMNFEVGKAGRVVMDVFDIHGRHVKRIVDEALAPGPHSRAWRGDDDHGSAVGSGVYYVQMKSADFAMTRRVLRIQ
jgi:flagellar hook assembly protein FlgD